jgi:[ribosomal protein S18]-alanine N-acetyltransferase
MDPAAGDLVIAPMRRRHLPAVLAIEEQVQPRPWSERIFRSELGQSNRCYLVAHHGGSVVGFAGVLLVLDEGHVTNIAVDPSWHRRAVATRLLVRLCRTAVERGSRNLTLEVRMSNDGAQALYRRFGFAPGGVRKAYYPDNREDALVMWAHDIDLPSYEERLVEIERAAGPAIAEAVDGIEPADAAPAGVRSHPAAGRMGEP